MHIDGHAEGRIGWLASDARHHRPLTPCIQALRAVRLGLVADWAGVGHAFDGELGGDCPLSADVCGGGGRVAVGYGEGEDAVTVDRDVCGWGSGQGQVATAVHGDVGRGAEIFGSANTRTRIQHRCRGGATSHPGCNGKVCTRVGAQDAVRARQPLLIAVHGAVGRRQDLLIPAEDYLDDAIPDRRRWTTVPHQQRAADLLVVRRGV